MGLLVEVIFYLRLIEHTLAGLALAGLGVLGFLWLSGRREARRADLELEKRKKAV